MKVKTCRFLHASSSAMQWHPSLQPKSSAGAAAIFQAGRNFALARTYISSNRLSGSGAFMAINDIKSSSSLTLP